MSISYIPLKWQEEEKQRQEEQEEANLLASKQKLEAEIDAAWQKAWDHCWVSTCAAKHT